MANEEIGLYELILGVRQELQKVMNNSEVKEHPLLELSDLEIEVTVMVSKAGGGGFKFILLPIGIEAGGEFKSERLSRIKIKFGPYQEEEGVLPDGPYATKVMKSKIN